MGAYLLEFKVASKTHTIFAYKLTKKNIDLLHVFKAWIPTVVFQLLRRVRAADCFTTQFT